MRRLPSLFLVIGLLALCSGRRPQIDKVMENGVEVVLNHIKPYRVPGEPFNLSLEKEYSVDTEDPDLQKAGFSDIRQFGVDSRGCLYLTQAPRKDEDIIFQFDSRGRLMRSFGRVGQGPGEIEGTSYFGVNSRDEAFAVDSRTRKLISFTSTGEIAQETVFSRSFIGVIIPLENGNFLFPETQESAPSGEGEVFFDLLSPRFEKIRTFCRLKLDSFPAETGKVNAYLPYPTGTVASNRIYVGIPGREYEVMVYDLEGTLLRRIRKEYVPVEVTPAFRDEVLASAPKGNPIVERIYFPDHKPAFQYLFTDEAGQLFVSTSERDVTTGQNVCDIFNPSGVFVGRAAVGYYDLLRLMWEGISLDVVCKNGRFYVLHEKEDGYKEMVVYKATWR